MELRRVADQLRHLSRRHSAARRSSNGGGSGTERVLEVRRVNVQLVSGKRANLLLLECERGHRAAGQVVAEPAMRQRRPVADGRSCQHGLCAVAADQLLHRLRAVEKARAGLCDHSDTVRPRHDGVALLVHGRVKRQVRGSQQSTSGWRARAQQLNHDAAGTHEDAPIAQGGAQILRGESILRTVRRGAHQQPMAERHHGRGTHLARHGDELQSRLLCMGPGCGQQ